MAYTPSQLKLAKQIYKIGKQKGATRKEIKAALETGIVESNLSNPSGGDADSAGWRQERASLYPNPTNVAAAASRFFQETKAVRGKYSRSGDIAAAVQRPAAQYRGRYQQHASEANRLLKQLEGGGGASKPYVSSPGTSSARPRTSTSSQTTTQTTTYTPGVDNAATRQALLLNYIPQRNNPDALLNLIIGLKGAQDTPGNYQTDTATSLSNSSALPVAAGNKVNQYKAAADLLDAAKLPYQWGGGHGKPLKLLKGGKPVPVDCSGAVSAVLGINPRVASEFEGWGQPGKGKKVTIYAKDTHVLMEINGHFFGTSKSNPGGGAGWIPRKALPAGYLAGFVARHPPGM